MPEDKVIILVLTPLSVDKDEMFSHASPDDPILTKAVKVAFNLLYSDADIEIFHQHHNILVT